MKDLHIFTRFECKDKSKTAYNPKKTAVFINIRLVENYYQ